MSEFLGPIHYMMYDKIKFQDEITNYLLDGDSSEVDKVNKPVSTDSLENLIDQDNIHGWLDSRIDIVESRLNYALHHSENPKEKMYQLGEESAKGKDFSDYNAVFSDLNKLLLDGMPCDNGLAAQVDDKGDLYLITNNNMHSKYENKNIDPKDSLDNTCEGGHGHDHHENFEVAEDETISLKSENSNYHEYRYEFLKGYFANSPYNVEMINGINYRIYPKNKVK